MEKRERGTDCAGGILADDQVFTVTYKSKILEDDSVILCIADRYTCYFLLLI